MNTNPKISFAYRMLIFYTYLIYIYIYIYTHTQVYIWTIIKGLGLGARQFSSIVSTYGHFQGNLLEIVEIAKIAN